MSIKERRSTRLNTGKYRSNSSSGKPPSWDSRSSKLRPPKEQEFLRRELRKDRKLSLPFGNSADVFGRQRATSRYEARVFWPSSRTSPRLPSVGGLRSSHRHRDKLQRLR